MVTRVEVDRVARTMVQPTADQRGQVASGSEVLVWTDDVVALRARSRGRGRALVLCHGGPGLWDNLDDLAGLLGDLFTVWTYDQRGCGRSGGQDGPYTVNRFTSDLEAVRGATGSERIIVGGHSWGAALALLWVEHPLEMRRAVEEWARSLATL